jgi:hypothetical protein
MNEGFQDQSIKCSECGNGFLWPAKDQVFYQSKGFMPPKRCRNCRNAEWQSGRDGSGRPKPLGRGSDFETDEPPNY